MHRTYENKDITVFWDSEKCFHSTVCWRNCPDAFDPKRKPWVRLDIADNAEVWQTVEKCPSKALSIVYRHEIDVLMDRDNCRSVALYNGKQIGECEFQVEDGKWCIYHTGVSEEFEGKKIAKRLVFKVLEEAERSNISVFATCSYARQYTDNQ